MGGESYGNVINDMNNKGVLFFGQRGGKSLVYNNTVNTASWATYTYVEEYLDSIQAPANNVMSGQPQHISESYGWGNKKNGATAIAAEITRTVDYSQSSVYDGVTHGPEKPYRTVPQWNLDCWQEVAGFDGSSGVGVGPLSARPVTCTKGVAYWATDTKTLYRATATNTWSVYYTPYTYPHPLRNR
jgi:hypothetical protein